MNAVNYLTYDPLTKTTQAIGKARLIFPNKPLILLENWANAYGLGIQGSHSAFKSRLCIRQKIPVLIDPFSQIYFFPTLSPCANECQWINAAQIKQIKQTPMGAQIWFLDGTKLDTMIGRRSLVRQWERCKMMEHLILRHRLSESPTSLTLLR